eukprot:symbB.v1.2.022853.t1/scaffold2032.1/size91878/5
MVILPPVHEAQASGRMERSKTVQVFCKSLTPEQPIEVEKTKWPPLKGRSTERKGLSVVGNRRANAVTRNLSSAEIRLSLHGQMPQFMFYGGASERGLWNGADSGPSAPESIGKTILIAKSSNWRDILSALQWMVVAASLGGSLGTIATLVKAGRPSGLPAVLFLVCGLSLVVDNDAFRQFMNLLGQMFTWLQVTHSTHFFYSRYKGIPEEVTHVVHVCYWLMISIVFCVMEVDRINSRSTRSEEKELRQGYQGSIRSAKCLQKADAASIRTEIGDKVRDVDHAIQVLLSAGMSTPALREIAHAVNIEQAAYSEITGAVFLLGPFGSLAVTTTNLAMIYGGASRFFAILPCISVMARVILFVLLCRSARDEQRFILKLMSKCVAVLLWLFVGIVVLCLFLHDLRVSQGADAWLLIADSCLLIIVYIALLGIRGTAKLPLGVRVLQVVFGRGRKAFLVCRRREAFSFDLESDSSGADTE